MSANNAPSSPSLPFARFVLAGSMLVMGACGMIYEYCLGVLGNNLIGSSREQIFVIIGLMMFAMGIGATWQQRFEKNLIDRFLWLECALGVIGGFSTLLIFAAFAWTDAYALVMYSFAFAIGVLIGCEIPLLVRINATYEKKLQVNLSSILSMDYVGSLIGALLFTYILVTRMALDRISVILGIVNVAIALGGLLFFWKLVHRRGAILITTLVALVGLSIALGLSQPWMERLEQRCFEDPIVYSETTKYQHIVMTKRKDHLRMYLDGHLQFSSRDESIYHELLVHLPMTLAAERTEVLILGGGDGLALREVLKYGDVERATLVDIDDAVISLASEHPDLIRLNRDAFADSRVDSRISAGIRPGPLHTVTLATRRDPLLDKSQYELGRVHVVQADADQFLRQVESRYDVVLIDFPDPRSVELAKLYSVPFYRTLSRRLNPGGFVSIQSTSPAAATEVFCCVGKTLEAADWKTLPYHWLVPSFGDWGWHLAWRGDLDATEVQTRIREIEAFRVETEFLNPGVAQASLAFGNGVLETRREVLPNTRWHPIVIHYHDRAFR